MDSRRALVCVALSSLLGAACGGMGGDEVGFFTGVDTLNRREAKAQLRLGLALNAQTCPTNQAAAYYAYYYTIPAFLNDTHYRADRIETCMWSLALTPCLPAEVANSSTFLPTIYGAVLSVCSPQKSGL